MQRRRGLVSNAGKAKVVPVSKPVRPRIDVSDSDSDAVDTSARKSSDSVDGGMDSSTKCAETDECDHIPAVSERIETAESDSKIPVPEDVSKPVVEKPRKNKKGKVDISDETRFKKMRIKGVDREILVDMTRVQKYVDYDSVGVQSLQAEIESAKGNFRGQQHAVADYSDL